MKFLSNVNITSQNNQPVSIDFTAEVPVRSGDTLSRKLYWDDTNRTLSFDLGNGVKQQIGQELITPVRNNTGQLIPNGSAVMVVGTVGVSGRLLIDLATNTTENHTNLLGITTEDIPDGADGLITSLGLVHELNTSGWAANDILYVDPNNPGHLTNITPVAPYSSSIVARVVYVDAALGSIFVRIGFSSKLNDLNNVQITDVAANDLLIATDLGTWENVHITDFRLAADQIDLTDAGEYFDSLNLEDLSQEMAVYLYNTMSSGVTKYIGMTRVDDTHINIGAMEGYIINSETDPAHPTLEKVIYAGTNNLVPDYLTTANQTTFFLGPNGTIVQSPTDSATGSNRRQYIFLGRAIHPYPGGVITAVENVPQIAIAPLAQLRDLWRAIGPINEGVYPYPAGGNLKINLNGGWLNYSGINMMNDNSQPTRLTIPSAAPVTIGYRSRTGSIISDGITDVDVVNWDNNGTIETIPQPASNAVNHRVFLTRAGKVLLQYGQKVYPTLESAAAGASTEVFTTAPTLKSNAILIGIISVYKNTTNLADTASARFISVSKFGEVNIGGAASGTAVTALNVAVVDSAGYFSGSNAEDVFEEIGLALNNVVNTTSSVTAGTGIDVSSQTTGANTDYTVTHKDTSTLSGQYGTEGVKSITVDGLGHITAVTTDTYLTSTSESKDFGKVTVSDTDTGYTWAGTGTTIADTNADTLTLVSGNGINIDVDAVADAIRITSTITQYSHPTQTAISSDNSNGVVLQDITVNNLGHVTSVGTYDLDNRYYTETETNNLLNTKQNTTIVDAGEFYTSTDVEGALQEIGNDFVTIGGDISTINGAISDIQNITFVALNYKGVIAAQINFPVSPKVGDLYYVTADDIHYFWNGTVWTVLGGGGSGNIVAADVAITDTGAYFISDEVEGALQEAGNLLGNALYGTDAITGEPIPLDADTLDGKHASDLEAFSIAMAIALS